MLTPFAFAAFVVSYAAVWGSGLLPRYDAIGLPLVVLAYTRLDERRTSRARAALVSLAGLTVALGAFVHLARTGMEGRAALVGPFNPWSDARDYLSDALRLVHGEAFTAFGIKRPAYPLVLAGLLRAFLLDVRIAVLVPAVAAGLALGPAVARFHRYVGAHAATLLLFVALTALRRFGSTLGSEALALPLMLVGAAALAPCMHSASFTLADATLAVLSLTLAQAARPGALFALPALVVALTIAAPKHSRRRAGVTLAAAFGATWAMPSLLGKTLGTGVSFVDYPPIFYGMLHGEDFTLIFTQHPELRSLDASLRAGAMTAIIGDALVHAPWLLPVGLLRAVGAFLVTPHGLFSLAWTCSDDHVLEGPAARAALRDGGLAGALRLWTETLGGYSLLNTVVAALVAAAVTGILLRHFFLAFRDARRSVRGHIKGVLAFALLTSPGFTPVWITEGAQLSLATLPLLALLGARDDVSFSDFDTQPLSTRRSYVVAAMLFAVLPLLRGALALAPLAPPNCAPEPETACLVPLPSTATRVAADDALGIGRMSARTYRWQRSFLARHFEDLTSALDAHVRLGSRLATAYDARTREAVLTVTDPIGAPRLVEPTASPAAAHASRVRVIEP